MEKQVHYRKSQKRLELEASARFVARVAVGFIPFAAIYTSTLVHGMLYISGTIPWLLPEDFTPEQIMFDLLFCGTAALGVHRALFELRRTSV